MLTLDASLGVARGHEQIGSMTRWRNASRNNAWGLGLGLSRGAIERDSTQFNKGPYVHTRAWWASAELFLEHRWDGGGFVRCAGGARQELAYRECVDCSEPCDVCTVEHKESDRNTLPYVRLTLGYSM
jgi:hypothetical protein